MNKLTASTIWPALSLSAARLSLAAAAATLILLAMLHILSPEFDPSWRMVSEYAFGEYPWVVALMFLTWGLSCVSLFFAIQSYVRSLGGKIGLIFLIAAAVGMVMAAVFDARHSLHGLAVIIGNPGFLIAAVLISVSLRRNPGWTAARRALFLTATLAWISVALMVAAVFIGLSLNGGEFGPGVLVGWPNRLLVASYCAWLMVAARQTLELERE